MLRSTKKPKQNAFSSIKKVAVKLMSLMILISILGFMYPEHKLTNVMEEIFRTDNFTATDSGKIKATQFYDNNIENSATRTFLPENITKQNSLNPNLCYLVADNGGGGVPDRLFSYDPATNAQVNIGLTGTVDIEAITIDPVNNILYAFDEDIFGTLNPTTGAFTQISQLGTITGAAGNRDIDDVDGMTYDIINNIIWGSERRSSGDDLIFQLNPITGMVITDAFGPGVDYLVVDTPEDDIDDIAMNSLGELYAISNDGGTGNQRLIIINKTNGTYTDIGNYGITDVEGLTFTRQNQLMASTGKDGNAAQNNRIYSINPFDASSFELGTISGGDDFEACACNAVPYTSSSLIGQVWLDVNQDNVSAGEDGFQGVEMRLLDGNENPILINGQPFITFTDINGFYSFSSLSSGNYIVEVGSVNNIYSFSAKDVGNNDAIDSDFDSNTRRTGIYTISNNTPVENVDLGLQTCSGGSDTDNDGLVDVCDLDDDNDGITDADEGCPECNGNAFLNGNFEQNPTTSTFLITDASNIPAWETTSTDNNIEIWRSGFNSGTPAPVSAQNGNYFAEINATQNSALYQRVCTQPGAQISWSVWHRGRSGTDVAVVKIGDDFATAPVQTTMTTGPSAWVQYSGVYNVPVDQGFTYFIFEAVSTAGGNITVGNFVDNIIIEEISPGFCLDTDNDGTPDSKDLDSDGDGCSDVVESGGVDANNDGVLDGSGFNNNGLVTGGTGGYDGASGSETMAARVTVTTVPSRTVKGGSSTNFTVAATAEEATSYNNGTPIYGINGNGNSRLNYQWYVGNPNSGGVALNNNAIYSNVNTATLLINNTEGLNNYDFCVVVSHQNNTCVEAVRCGTLTLTENCSNGVDDDDDGLIDCADPECVPATPNEIINN